MKLSSIAPVLVALSLARAAAAQQYQCSFDIAQPWPADSSDSSSDESSAEASIVGAADSQAICLSDLDADASDCESGDDGDDGDDGILRARQEAPVDTLTCSDTEVCYVYTNGYLICLDPDSGDYEDQFETGNVLTGAHTLTGDQNATDSTATDEPTTATTTATTDFGGAASTDAAETATTDAFDTATTDAVDTATTDAVDTATTSDLSTTASETEPATTMTTAPQSSPATTTQSAPSSSAFVLPLGAAAAKQVGTWSLWVPAAVAPILVAAL